MADMATRIKEGTEAAVTTEEHQAFDVMVATFADRGAARQAYKELKDLEKRGAIDMQSALVLDRDTGGRMHLEGAQLPWWLWSMSAVLFSLTAGALGFIAYLTARTILRAFGGRGD